jgi:NAD(P)-dependent dehydrogenase (short-subunit alcohol dehydrogenase family)
MAESMEGKVVAIAGLSSGLGEVIAERFAEAGARLVLSDPEEDAVNKAVRQLQDAHAESEPAGVVAEFTDLESCEAMVASAVARHGKLDALIIATVTAPRRREPLVSIDPDEWDRIFAINAKGPFLLCRSAIPALTRPGGSIAIVGSFTAQKGVANLCAYSASKGALASLTRSLSLELAADGIRVNLVAPGYLWSTVDRIEVEKQAAAAGKSVEEFSALRDSTIPFGRRADTREVAEALFFLGSPASSYITGACLDVNGGLYLR